MPSLCQATISYYQMMHMQTAPLPVHFQMLCESSKLYDPGQQYASHVRQLQRDEEPDVHYDFEPHVPTSNWYGRVRVPWEPAPHRRWGKHHCLSDPHHGSFSWLPFPPGPLSCVPGKAASMLVTLRKRLAALLTKADPARGCLPRSAGVSAQWGWVPAALWGG